MIFCRTREFFFAPASARPLAVLRIGLASLLLLQAFLLRHSIWSFLSPDGWLQGDLAEYLSPPWTPRLHILAQTMAWSGLSESDWIRLVPGAYCLALVAMLVGWLTRTSSILVWFLHWVLISSCSTLVYGVDMFAHVFLFLLIWAPAGDSLSIDAKLKQRVWDTGPSIWARLCLRACQLQLCLTYLDAGLEKARGIQWWNGELLWRTLSLPLYNHNQVDFSWLALHPWITTIAGWVTLILEIGYPIFIWPARTRRVWIFGIVGLHLGIIFLLGLHLFGLIMCLLTLALFGVPADDSLNAFLPGKNAGKRAPSAPSLMPLERVAATNVILA